MRFYLKNNSLLGCAPTQRVSGPKLEQLVELDLRAGRAVELLDGAAQAHRVRGLLRGGASDEALLDAITGIWQAREDRYSEVRTAATASERKIEMSYIGG